MANRDGIEDGSGWGGLTGSTPDEKEIDRLTRKLAEAQAARGRLAHEVDQWRAFGQMLTGVDASDCGWLRAELESRWRRFEREVAELQEFREMEIERTRELQEAVAEIAELRSALAALYAINWADEGDNEGYWSEPFRSAMYAARSLLPKSPPAQGGSE